jgi:hypothetical protein
MLQKYNVEEDPIDPTPQLSPLSPISSLQLDELELELEDELEELELDDPSKGISTSTWMEGVKP